MAVLPATGRFLVGLPQSFVGLPGVQYALTSNGAVVTELATGKKAYFMGKPNPLMMRTGLHLLGVHSEEAAMVGDRMDTDVIAGMESGLATVLVLSGCTSRADVDNYPYRPTYILNGVGEIVAE